MSEKWAYLAEFTVDDIEDIAEPLQAAKELLVDNAALEVGLADVDRILQIEMKENTALKRAREYIEEVCEEDFVMWCREQDALLTAEESE